MDEAKEIRQSKQLHSLFVQMVDLLIAYEVETMALGQILRIAEAEFMKIDAGKDPGLRKAAADFAASPANRISAEQKFVKLSQLRKGLTEQNLNLALAGIQDVIARKTGQRMPG